MNKKHLYVLAATLAILGTAGLGMYASAYQGNLGHRTSWFSQERYDAMQKAFENNDYGAWKNLMQERINGRKNWMELKITPDNFARFSEMHLLMRQGKFEEAGKIRAELGLPERGERGMGRRCGLSR